MVLQRPYGFLFLTRLGPFVLVISFRQVPGLLRARTRHVEGPEVDLHVVAAGLHGLRALGLRDKLQGRDPEAEQEALGQLEAGGGGLSLSLSRGVEDAQTDEVTTGARAEGIRTRGLAIKTALYLSFKSASFSPKLLFGSNRFSKIICSIIFV